MICKKQSTLVGGVQGILQGRKILPPPIQLCLVRTWFVVIKRLFPRSSRSPYNRGVNSAGAFSAHSRLHEGQSVSIGVPVGLATQKGRNKLCALMILQGTTWIG